MLNAIRVKHSRIGSQLCRATVSEAAGQLEKLLFAIVVLMISCVQGRGGT